MKISNVERTTIAKQHNRLTNVYTVQRIVLDESSKTVCDFVSVVSIGLRLKISKEDWNDQSREKKVSATERERGVDEKRALLTYSISSTKG